MQASFASLRTPQSIRPMQLPLAALLFVTVLAGCASTPAPTSQLAVSRAAVARASNADTTLYAPVVLQSAKDKLAAAEKAMAAENYELAAQLAEQAQVDARLAETRSQAAKAEKAAEDSQAGIRVLQEELDRKAQQP